MSKLEAKKAYLEMYSCARSQNDLVIVDIAETLLLIIEELNEVKTQLKSLEKKYENFTQD